MNHIPQLDSLELELLRAELFERLYEEMSAEVNPCLDGHLVTFVRGWTDDLMTWPSASIRRFMGAFTNPFSKVQLV